MNTLTDLAEFAANAKKSASIMRAVKHGFWQQILLYLMKNPALTVTEIYVHFREEQSVVSQHLAILREAGVVKSERSGKHIRYSLNQSRIQQINGAMNALLTN